MHGHKKYSALPSSSKLSLGTLTYGSSDQWRGVPDVVEAFALDEIGHIGGEVLVVCLHIVLQYEPTQGSGGLIWTGHEDSKYANTG